MAQHLFSNFQFIHTILFMIICQHFRLSTLASFFKCWFEASKLAIDMLFHDMKPASWLSSHTTASESLQNIFSPSSSHQSTAACGSCSHWSRSRAATITTTRTTMRTTMRIMRRIKATTFRLSSRLSSGFPEIFAISPGTLHPDIKLECLNLTDHGREKNEHSNKVIMNYI